MIPPVWPVLILLLGLLPALAASAATLTLVCGSHAEELRLCQEGSQAWAEQTGHQVRVVAAPGDSRLELLRQLLAVGAPDIDVLQIDVIWAGLLAPQLLDLNNHLSAPAAGHMPALVRNNTVDGRLVALPWYASVGRLFYRRDLLEAHGQPVPTDWEQLHNIARRVQNAERQAGNSQFWGFVWQGQAHEGLSSNALEWIASHGGGSVVEADGRISVNNPRSLAALSRASSWLGDISPTSVLDHTGSETLAQFQAGNALFMRHWSTVSIALDAEDSTVANRYGSAPLPADEDGLPAATLGGWQLAVSRHSTYPAEAATLAAWLTGAEEQRRRALEAGFAPTRPALYRDPALLAERPELDALYPSLLGAVVRPSGVTGQRYPAVSQALWEAVRTVLEDQVTPARALSRLERYLQRLSRNGSHW